MIKWINVVISMLIVGVWVSCGFANNATITKMEGEVEVLYKGEKNWDAPRLYYVLKSGDKIRTKNGKAELILNDGSVINIRENTYLEMTKLEFDAVKRVSILQLLMGKIKSKVTKRDEGSIFEIRSSNAIAAVKGTEFIVEVFEKTTDVIVLEGVVALSDIMKEKEIFIKENEKSSLKENILESPRELLPEEKMRIKEVWETGKLEKKENGESEEAKKKDIKKEMFDLRKELIDLRKDLTDLRDRSDMETKQDQLERLNDTQNGVVNMDRHGYRIRTEEHILRPDPRTITFLSLTGRKEGPDAGISKMEINNVFNQPLPENFMDIKKWVDSSEWAKSSSMPSYFYMKQDYILKNPYGDSIVNDKMYSQPKIESNCTGLLWRQPYCESLSVNNNFKYSEILDYDGQGLCFKPMKWINSSGATVFTKEQAVTESPLIKLSDGGYIRKLEFTDGTFLENKIFVIDDIGKSVEESLYTNTPIAEIKHLYVPYSLIKFNYELEFNAPEFGSRNMDLIISPCMFKEFYRILDTTPVANCILNY
ncbi:MAG: FecR domain-containing protein [Candidatus Firestonebacteria bacterium]